MSKKSKVTFDPKKFLAKLGYGKAIAKHQKDQIVFSQGDVADAVFYIQKGKLKRSNGFRAGKGSRNRHFGPGHFFGEGCLNGHGLRAAATTTIDECMITRIAKAAMIATLHDETDFSELFMSYLLARNSRIEEDLAEQLFNSSERRLARLLLLLATFGKHLTRLRLRPMRRVSRQELCPVIPGSAARAESPESITTDQGVWIPGSPPLRCGAPE